MVSVVIALVLQGCPKNFILIERTSCVLHGVAPPSWIMSSIGR